MKTFSKTSQTGRVAAPSPSKKTRGRTRGRKSTGQLIWRSNGWSARFMAVVDGERVRVCRPLDTDNKAVARIKLARLLETEGALPNDEATRPETFEEAAIRIVHAQKAEGLTTWTDRLQRLRQFAFPEFGHLPVTDVRPAHVRAALARGLKSGKARSTIAKVKIDISTVLAELWRDEVLPENVAQRVQLPKNAPVDDRERVILTDAEFEAFMACPDVHAELHTMALVSRTLGGARTSDLHAWDWAHVDTIHWLDACRAPRPRAATGWRCQTCSYPFSVPGGTPTVARSSDPCSRAAEASGRGSGRARASRTRLRSGTRSGRRRSFGPPPASSERRPTRSVASCA